MGSRLEISFIVVNNGAYCDVMNVGILPLMSTMGFFLVLFASCSARILNFNSS